MAESNVYRTNSYRDAVGKTTQSAAVASADDHEGDTIIKVASTHDEDNLVSTFVVSADTGLAINDPSGDTLGVLPKFSTPTRALSRHTSAGGGHMHSVAPALQPAGRGTSVTGEAYYGITHTASSIDIQLYNNGTKYGLICILLGLSILSLSYGAWSVIGEGDLVAVARGTGRYITTGFTLLLIISARGIWTRLGRIVKLRRVVALTEFIPFWHSMTAYSIIIAAVIHAFGQVANYSIENVGDPVFKEGLWHFPGDSCTKDDPEGKPTIQLFITGILLCILWIVIPATAQPGARRVNYRLFWNVHIYGAASVTILIILHGSLCGRPFSWMFVVPALVFFLISKVYDGTFCGVTKLQILSVRLSECKGVIRLETDGKPWEFLPGQYANISISHINGESHSFTIACGPQSPNLIFFIAAVGPWTKQLLSITKKHIEWQEDPANEGKIEPPLPLVEVRGPFGAPTEDFFSFPRLLLVGSGVGATPMVSVLDHLEEYYKSRVSEEFTPEEAANFHQMFSDAEWSNIEAAHYVWRREVLHAHDWTRLFNRVSVLWLQVYLLVITTSLTLAFEFFESRKALIVPLASEVVTIFCFGARSYGIWKRVPDWSRRKVLRLLTPHIAATSLALLVAVAHFAFSIFAIVDIDNIVENELTVFFIVDVALDLLHFIFIYASLKMDIDVHTHRVHPSLSMNSAKVPPRSVHFVWIVRTVDQLWWLEELRRATAVMPRIVADIFVTRQAANTLPASDNNTICFHAGRPDFESVIESAIEPLDIEHIPLTPEAAEVANSAQEKLKSHSETMGVFFCGAPAIADSLSEACDDFKANNAGCRIFFHEEHFS